MAGREPVECMWAAWQADSACTLFCKPSAKDPTIAVAPAQTAHPWPSLPARSKVLLMGLCGAVDTLASQASGAGQPLGIIFQRAVLFLAVHWWVGGLALATGSTGGCAELVACRCKCLHYTLFCCRP